jgi:hypothetical protein
MEIKIVFANDQYWGIQKNHLGIFHEYCERFPYMGSSVDGEIVDAELVYQAKYPINQWADMPDEIAADTDRVTRRIYRDSRTQAD